MIVKSLALSPEVEVVVIVVLRETQTARRFKSESSHGALRSCVSEQAPYVTDILMIGEHSQCRDVPTAPPAFNPNQRFALIKDNRSSAAGFGDFRRLK